MVDEVEGEVEGDGGKDAGDEGPVEGAAVEDQLEASKKAENVTMGEIDKEMR